MAAALCAAKARFRLRLATFFQINTPQPAMGVSASTRFGLVQYLSWLKSNTTKIVFQQGYPLETARSQALEIGNKLGIDWSRSNEEQFRMGLEMA